MVSNYEICSALGPHHIETTYSLFEIWWTLNQKISFSLTIKNINLPKFLIAKMSFALKYPLVGKGCVAPPGKTWTNVYPRQTRPWWPTEGTHPSLLNPSAFKSLLTGEWVRKVTHRHTGDSKTAASPEASHRVGDSSPNWILGVSWGICRQLHTGVSSPSASACGSWGGTPWGLELWPAWTSSLSSAFWVL